MSGLDPAPKVKLLRKPRGRIQPIADMRKTHLIVLCFAVSVILAVGIYVPEGLALGTVYTAGTGPNAPANQACYKVEVSIP